VEAAFMPEMRFVWGVQWHPEYNFEQDKYSRTLFDVFIRFAGNQ
jgi:putative glutamine amidotransferase